MYKGIKKKKKGKNLKDVKLAHKLDEQNLSILTTNPLYLISQLPTILLFAPMEKKPMMSLQHFKCQ
jgi:hypothetical protein